MIDDRPILIYILYMILGLDASTVSCGWALNDGGLIVDAGHMDISKYVLNKDKAMCVMDGLASYNGVIDGIGLEGALASLA